MGGLRARRLAATALATAAAATAATAATGCGEEEPRLPSACDDSVPSLKDALATEAPRSDAAALRLGYLVGATHRGAARTSGLHAELIRRLESSAGLEDAPAARRAAYARGLAAGRARG